MAVRVRDHQDADWFTHHHALVATRASSLTRGATRRAIRKVTREKPLAVTQREELKDSAKHSDHASHLDAVARLFSLQSAADADECAERAALAHLID